MHSFGIFASSRAAANISGIGLFIWSVPLQEWFQVHGRNATSCGLFCQRRCLSLRSLTCRRNFLQQYTRNTSRAGHFVHREGIQDPGVHWIISARSILSLPWFAKRQPSFLYVYAPRWEHIQQRMDATSSLCSLMMIKWISNNALWSTLQIIVPLSNISIYTIAAMRKKTCALFLHPSSISPFADSRNLQHKTTSSTLSFA